MKETISIVIPIYNCAKYLSKCIDSILDQTYKNLEIILVDDGSTDESGKIIDNYANKDNRIKVIHKENGGPGNARNSGLIISTGKYIAFIDSDDFIEKDMYEFLLNILIAYGADIIQCALYFVKGDKIILPKDHSGAINQFNVLAAMEELIKKRKFNTSVLNKIYKKDLINGIKFKENVHLEVNDFNYKVFARAQKLVSVDTPKYYYVKRNDGVIGSLSYLEKMYGFYDYLERLEFISKNFPSLFNLVQEKFYSFLIKTYIKLKVNEYLDKDKKKRFLIKNYIKTNYKSFASNPIVGKKHKLLLKVLRINFETYFNLRHFYLKLKKTRSHHK